MYIHGTLSNGEKIEMVLNMHWIIYLFPMLLFAFGVFLEIYSNSMLSSIAFGVSLIYGLRALLISSTTEQVLTSRRVFGKIGVISRTTDELKNKQLETISISQSFAGMLFGYGDIKYTGTGGAFVLHRFVPNPQKVKRDFEALLYPDENAPSPATGKSEIIDDGKL